MASRRKPKEVTAEDLERGLDEVARRERAMESADRWPNGRPLWSRLLEEDEEDPGP